ncbi:MAG: glycerol-3-phosphate 1-O-acyltransferase [bacterium]|nr:glycerol-3-phosphate 1-O-acyltransferase [bacterium]MCP5045015.1 glycerol-3-phosphate 1-O-acyltransferase [bacterium]
MTESTPEPKPLAEPQWPSHDGRAVVFLLDAASSLEERILRDWIERKRPEGVAPADVEAIRIPSSRVTRVNRMGPLEPALATSDDPLLAPLRVLWLPKKRKGRRVASLRDVLNFGDPRDPGTLRAGLIARMSPDRVRVVAGEPAPESDLRERWRAACGRDVAETMGLAHFVARQAALALDRAERQVRGNRYKVPRFLREEILARPSFQGGLDRLAREEGMAQATVRKRAQRYLKEIAANHSPLMIDIFAQLCRSSSTRGYDALRFDQRELDRIRELAEQHPVAFLPTHKSNLDHPVVFRILHEDGMPPNHTAGGINMNFFPTGPIVRRAGIFFIRRSFTDNEIYKFVLRAYIDFLVEKRFPLEWFIEGGRSRSGKLLPPRYGMLSYVVDSFRRGKAEDVILIPVSIAYDQISEVDEYSAEERGAVKQAESFAWLVKFLGGLDHHFGSIDVRFGEPLSLRAALGPPRPDANDTHYDELTVPKLAFEVCTRINRVTPITPISLSMVALLACGDRAMSLAEIHVSLNNLVDYVNRRGLPTTTKLDFGSTDDVAAALDPLVQSGVLMRFDEGPEVIYSIASDQHLSAAYYRNTVIHFLVSSGILEIALLRAAESLSSDSTEEFWDEAMRIRDLMKFDFFFPDKDRFREEMKQELALHSDRWEEYIADPAAARAFVEQIRPFHAHRTLRAFVEAYQVVADRLVMLGREPAGDESRLLKDCMVWGKQYTLQRRIRSAESVSKLLLHNGFKLAKNRGLLEGDPEVLAKGREALVDELREVSRRLNVIDALASARRAAAGGAQGR